MNDKIISISLDQDTLDELDDISEELNRNRSDTIRQIIKEWKKK